MLKDFADQDFYLLETDRDRIHAPIGVNIGAETPDEIGISIKLVGDLKKARGKSQE